LGTDKIGIAFARNIQTTLIRSLEASSQKSEVRSWWKTQLKVYSRL